MKKFLSFCIAFIMILSAAPFGITMKSSALEENYSVGDHLFFGSYPQTRVSDSELIEQLNETDAEWISYNYYSGTGTDADGQMRPSDYMKYRDVEIGDAKYRGVIFSSNRRGWTHFSLNSQQGNYQKANGYDINTVYWFKFDPLEWTVLDPEAGLVLCSYIIDSQPYNSFILENGGEYYGDESCSSERYANNYCFSSIRQWLNDDFYNTAFSQSQKSRIETASLNNDCPYQSGSKYNSPATQDKIFLLSQAEATNSDYGFAAADKENGSMSRLTKGTDYALCQGLVQRYTNYPEKVSWWLRSPGTSSKNAFYVDYAKGYCQIPNSADDASIGVRPALYFSSGDFIPDVTDLSEAFAGGDGTRYNPYIISTAEHLELISRETANGNTFENKYFKLGNDINLNSTADYNNWETNAPENSWTPIGVYSDNTDEQKPFCGNFNGDNHTISGLYISGSEYAGLFSYCFGASISNLTILKSFFSAEESGASGAFSAVVEDCNIDNCKSFSKISAANAGGISGYSSGTTFNCCANCSDVNGTMCAGGIFGTYKIDKKSSTITNSYNTGAIKSNYYAGGLAGKYNLTVILKTNSPSYAYGKYYFPEYTTGISKCYNCGSINGENSAGGLVGFMQMCTNKFTVTSPDTLKGTNGCHTIESYNVGFITGSNYCGQLIGRVSSWLSIQDTLAYCRYCDVFEQQQLSVGYVDNNSSFVDRNCYDTKGIEKENALTITSWIPEATAPSNILHYTIWEMDPDAAYPYPTLIINPHTDNHIHSYEMIVTAPTCTEKGYTTYTCECGASYVDDYVDALGHDFGDWTVTTPATCESAGEETRYCSRCDMFETRPTEKGNHEYISVVTDPTCTERGYTTYTCSNCESSYVDDYVDALGHDFGEWQTTAYATCESAGAQRRECSRCDAFETREIPANGHNCIMYYQNDASCVQPGETVYQCTECGEKYTEQIPVKPHSLKHIRTDASCTADGEDYDFCLTCGNSFNYLKLPANGHNYVNGVCTVCGNLRDWEFSVSGGNLTITKYKGSDKNLIIPDTLVGYKVSAVADSAFKDCKTLEYVRIPDGVLSIGKDAFRGCDNLKEVYIGEKTAGIGSNAFASCPKLALACVMNQSVSLKNIFSGNDARLVIYAYENSQSAKSAEAAKLKVIPFSYPKEKDGKNAVAFIGSTVVYQDLDYNFWGDIANKYPDTYYFYFSSLTFDGIREEDFSIEIDDSHINDNEYLTISDVYIGLNLNGRQLTFRELMELLQHGQLDAQIEFIDSQGQKQTFFEKIGTFFSDVFNALSRAINSIIRIFKRK